MFNFSILRFSLLVFFLFLFFPLLHADNYHRVKIFLKDQSLKQLVETGIAPEFGDIKKDEYVTGEFSETELETIAKAGFRFEMLIEDVSGYYQKRNLTFDIDSLNREMRMHKSGLPYETPENFFLGSMGGFHTYNEVLDDLDAMRELFPGLISERLPASEIKTIEGRTVYYVRISNQPDEMQDKPKVLYTSLTHAREPASMQQMLYQMWYLLENYDDDPEIKYLVDHTEMYFIPVVNPDGYVYCETTNPDGGSMHRKNKRINTDGSIGVDLNRNFGYMWGYDDIGSSPTPSSATYRGTAPFSEPETQILKEFAENIDFTLALNNHTYSDLLIYPWGYANELTPDGDLFQEYAQYLTLENNYEYGTVYETLNYFANGGSDDWFYGEQETKNKVLSFTPEAGSPADGFWPAMNRIEEICAGHTHMNLALARLALPFARVKDLSDPYISFQGNSSIDLEVKNLGYYPNAEYTLQVIPLSDNLVSTEEEIQISDMEILETRMVSFELELDEDIQNGDEIKFVVSLENGLMQWNDTIIKYFGQLETILNDPANDLSLWETTEWGVSEEQFYSSPASIADSPGANYTDNANTEIILADPVDLSNITLVWVEFYTRYNIEDGWDFVQFMYSTDNKQTWVPLEGELTTTGGNNQDINQPVYDGSQLFWEKETVDLSPLAGQEEVWLKFRLVSDVTVNREGFYFDDFTIKALRSEPSYFFSPPDQISFYQHLDTIVDFKDFLSWSPQENQLSIHWQNNINFHIQKNDETSVLINNTDSLYTGEENVIFTVMYEDMVFNQEVLLQSKSVPRPIIADQENISVNQGDTLYFSKEFLSVEDSFFDYPRHFTIQIKDGFFYQVQNDTILIFQDDFAGTLSVPVVVHNGFTESIDFYVQIEVMPLTSADDKIINETRMVYNAQRNELSVSVPKDILPGPIDVSFFDLKGNRIKTIDLPVPAKQFFISLDFLPSGVYLVSISTQNTFLINRKITVVR
ncbi:MAG: M14 family zinc carboxypeptidase [Bacteroidales bacterium]